MEKSEYNRITKQNDWRAEMEKENQIKCKCEKCGCNDVCAFYDFVVKPVVEIVRDTDVPQEIEFVEKLVDAVKTFDCTEFEYTYQRE